MIARVNDNEVNSNAYLEAENVVKGINGLDTICFSLGTFDEGLEINVTTEEARKFAKSLLVMTGE